MKKSKIMKPENIHHEILLFTGTSYARREYCSRDEKDEGRKTTSMEELEKACWAGMLCELLPELMNNFGARPESFIWNIMSGKNFLHITIGPYPMTAENETAIDPYFFLSTTSEN